MSRTACAGPLSARVLVNRDGGGLAHVPVGGKQQLLGVLVVEPLCLALDLGQLLRLLRRQRGRTRSRS